MRNGDMIIELSGMVVMVLLTFAVFAIWPHIDIWVSRQFFSAEGGFVLATNPQLAFLRALLWNMSIFLAVVGLVALIVGAWRRCAVFGVPTRLWGYVVALFVLGPGLLVNGILKQDWGRARPAFVREFGGGAQFTPPHQITDACAANCSFVSGEVSGITAFSICILVLLPFARIGARWRRVIWWMAVALPFVSAAQRIVVGRHFLSDTIFAILFTAICARLLWHALKPAKA